MPDVPIPDDAREAEELAVEEHVVEILFDSLAEHDADCVLCKRAVEFGIFARFGFDLEDL